MQQLFLGIKDQEDRASEILIAVFDKLDSYNPKFALSTWIYSIARNSQIDIIRKNKIDTFDLDEAVIHTELTPETEIMKEYEIAQIRGFINMLKPAERELIYLYYYEEFNYREISDITGTPIGTLKYRMFNAKNKIKSRIERSKSYETDY